MRTRGSRRPKAVVAMSGGVDSSVAAALMVEQGYDVTGIMLKLWRTDDVNHSSGCCSVGAADDARRVADVLGIPFYVINLARSFEATVIADFEAAYSSGRTPNPCVRCNQWIKFDALLERAGALGAEVLATGHYARVVRRGDRHRLLRGADRRKDQSYVLWMLSQSQLARCRFPVGHLTKDETRSIAASFGLRTARKPDSQEICFVRGGDLDRYVSERLPGATRAGPIVATDGRTLGRHRGIGRYTVGQRKGLGIALGAPVFVTAIDAATNTVTVGDRTALAVEALECREASYTERSPQPGEDVLVQHRAHGDPAPGVVTAVGPGGFEVAFTTPVEAVAPGQSAALYAVAEPDRVVGGGIIAATRRAPVDV